MKFATLLRLSALCLLLAVAAACGAPAAPAATPVPPTPTAPVGGSWDDISQIVAIRIDDVWNGFSPLAPVESHYVLTNENGRFAGQADWSIARLGAVAYTATETLAAPTETVADFLRQLAAAPRVAGTYVPGILHTDDYPSITITIEFAGGETTFYSASQGADRAPWGATIDGVDYTIATAEPAGAMARLQPFLKAERLEALRQQAMADL